MERRVPVVVLTGFLGSGKTTLLNHVLKNKSGLRVAVLVNELGAIDIDSQLLEGAQTLADDTVQLRSGCVCCTIKTELEDTACRLLKTHASKLDYLVVETTGVADPGPIVYTFEKGVLNTLAFVEAVVTVTNAEDLLHVLRRASKADDGCGSAPSRAPIADHVTYAAVKSQLEHGDIIVVNKADLIHRTQLSAVVAAVRREFSSATVLTATFGDVPLEAILHPPHAGVASAAGASGADTAPQGAETKTSGEGGQAHHEHSDDCDHRDHAHSKHGHHGGAAESDHLSKDGFVSVAYSSDTPLEAWKFARFLRRHVPAGVVRMKGIVGLRYGPGIGLATVVIHKSGRRYNITPMAAARSQATPVVQLVFIGAAVDAASLQAKVAACAASQAVAATAESAARSVVCDELRAAIDSDHRFYWRDIAGAGGNQIVAFGLTGMLGFAMGVDIEGRNELNREFIQRVNRSLEPVFLLPMEIDAVVDPASALAATTKPGLRELVAVVDCRGTARAGVPSAPVDPASDSTLADTMPAGAGPGAGAGALGRSVDASTTASDDGGDVTAASVDGKLERIAAGKRPTPLVGNTPTTSNGVGGDDDGDLDAAELWAVVEREVVPVLTQLFASAMCC